MKKIYSTPQAAKKIGVSFITLHRWIRDGKIQARRESRSKPARSGIGPMPT
jgi:predicted site-specific integrase-resolvase